MLCHINKMCHVNAKASLIHYSYHSIILCLFFSVIIYPVSEQIVVQSSEREGRGESILWFTLFFVICVCVPVCVGYASLHKLL